MTKVSLHRSKCLLIGVEIFRGSTSQQSVVGSTYLLLQDLLWKRDNKSTTKIGPTYLKDSANSRVPTAISNQSTIVWNVHIDDVFLVWRPTNDWLAFALLLHWTWMGIFRIRHDWMFLDWNYQQFRHKHHYEKPMALWKTIMAIFLFIPSHSAHPHGILVGHIYGNLLRIFRLKSSEDDIIRDTLSFFLIDFWYVETKVRY